MWRSSNDDMPKFLVAPIGPVPFCFELTRPFDGSRVRPFNEDRPLELYVTHYANDQKTIKSAISKLTPSTTIQIAERSNWTSGRESIGKAPERLRNA